ncbi:MAG: putative ABC transporter permease [Clostridiales bacterium]|nr:putative ABC transporter permease [Clostridiales bacterium]MBR2821620.1 putative ABC transporter permease [Clostridiales bacterium]
MDKAYLRSRFPMLMLVFAFGGVFGFIYEEIFYRFDLGEWVKRGTTFGPWIPIYGFGALIILGLTFKFRKNPLLVFLFATIASGVLELVTGWVILKFFGVRLWDYNTEILNWGNINGFVCLRSVLFFGISGLFLQFILMPLFGKLEKKMPRKAWLALCYIPACIFILDIVISLICKAVK